LALAARESGNQDGLETSGLPALERYIRSTLIDQKRAHLKASIARKTADIVDILQADAALAARALTMPLTELDEKISIFEAAVTSFACERDNLHDLLSGEWSRAIAKLDVMCEHAEKRARSQFENVAADVNRFSHLDVSQLGADQSVTESVMSAIFDKEFKAISEAVDEDLKAAITKHQHRYHLLVTRVRDSAMTLMNVSVPPVAPENWFQVKRKPYWIGEARLESLGSITADGLARFLPDKFRRKRRLKQLRIAVDNAITRNVSDLHWTMRQNIDESFRRVLGASGEAVDTSIAATREVLSRAQERRRSTGSSLQIEIEHANDVTVRLAALRDRLNQHLDEAS
jgi:hypothetical protein